MNFFQFTAKVSKFQTFFFFDNIVPVLDTLRKFNFDQNYHRIIIRSRLKNVATGSVSKRHQTNLLAQHSNSLLENVNFDLICPTFVIQKPPSKITRYGLHFSKQYVSSYFVG